MNFSRYVMAQDTKPASSQTTPADRLRRARFDAGFTKASEAARRLGMKVVTYISHENGHRGFGFDQAEIYGKKFKVDPIWIMTGRDTAKAPLELPRPMIGKSSEKDSWRINEEFLSDRLRMEQSKMDVVKVDTDAMINVANPYAPHTLHPGDRAIIDTSDREPIPPGVFLISLGPGRMEIYKLRYPNTPSLSSIEISALNPDYPSNVVAADDIEIYGRVVGRITSI